MQPIVSSCGMDKCHAKLLRILAQPLFAAALKKKVEFSQICTKLGIKMMEILHKTTDVIPSSGRVSCWPR
jgi:hypothetical protein